MLEEARARAAHLRSSRPPILAPRRHLLIRRGLATKEEDFQICKDSFGSDHSLARTYPALLRHLVLAMAGPSAPDRVRGPGGGLATSRRRFAVAIHDRTA